jgi:hypothetical protein
LFTFTWIVRVKSINCTGFSGKKTLNFSRECHHIRINSLALVFQKKKKTVHFSEQCYSGAMLHCWCFSQTRSSKTCGAMWVLPTESTFILVTKRLLTWLRVNLTPSHVTKWLLTLHLNGFLIVKNHYYPYFTLRGVSEEV